MSISLPNLSPKLLSFFGLITIQVSIALVYKLAQTDGKYAFSQASALAMSELVKFGMSCSMYAVVLRQEGRWEQSNPSTLFSSFLKDVPLDVIQQMFALALLYAFNNHLAFTIFKMADPGTIQLVKSGSTLLTALLLYIALLRPISQLQWLAILLQIAGLIVSQYNECAGTTHVTPMAYLLLLLQVSITAVTSAWNDHVTKANKQISLHSLNMALYCGGFFINFLVFLVRQFLGIEPGFFHGYDSIMAILVVVFNSLMGIAITAVYKYADAIVKTFATTFSTGLLLFISAIFFHASLTLTASMGVIVVFVATYIYMTYPAPSTDKPPTIVEHIRETFIQILSSKITLLVVASIILIASILSFK